MYISIYIHLSVHIYIYICMYVYMKRALRVSAACHARSAVNLLAHNRNPGDYFLEIQPRGG